MNLCTFRYLINFQLIDNCYIQMSDSRHQNNWTVKCKNVLLINILPKCNLSIQYNMFVQYVFTLQCECTVQTIHTHGGTINRVFVKYHAVKYSIYCMMCFSYNLFHTTQNVCFK